MNESTAVAVREVKALLDKAAPEFSRALPAHVPPERFRRIAETAILNNPDVLHANRRSLMSAVIKAAQDGLPPDGRQAALVVFRTKAGPQVQYMPMVAGLLRLARNSGQLAGIVAEVVHENDTFDREPTNFEAPVTHRPRTLDLVCDPPTLPPSVRLTPATGQPGSSVTARLLYFIPSEDVQMIFRGPGNPIVARGRTDTDGAASLQFVVPQYISGVYDVFTVNVADPNCDAVVQFTVIPGPPATATPTQAPPTSRSCSTALMNSSVTPTEMLKLVRSPLSLAWMNSSTSGWSQRSTPICAPRRAPALSTVSQERSNTRM